VGVAETEPQARIEKDVGRSGVTYRIKGTQVAVQNAIDWLMEKYHPMGYGTRVESMEGNAIDGVVEARVWRSITCD
jgi:hypothetical protein